MSTRRWSSFVRIGGGSALALTLAACQGDPTSAALAPASLRRDSVSVGLAVAHRLAPIPANTNTCQVRATARDAAGRVVGFQGTNAERVQLTPGARDTVLAHYTIWQFDGGGQQLAEATCILHRGEAARTFALGFFTTKAGRPAPLTGLGALSALGTTPVTGLSAISAGTSCYWIDGTTDVECDGMRCFVLFTTRAAANQRWHSAARADTAVRVPVGPSHLTAWECTNGGVLTLNANGTATYHPPGGGDDGGGGGGSGGSGTPCGGGGTGDPPDDGTADPPGGGGEDYSWWGAVCDTVVLPPPLDCPNADTLCLEEMDAIEAAWVETALSHVDTTRAICKEAFVKVVAVRNDGRLFRGKGSLPDNPSDPNTDYHDAQSRRGPPALIHVDSAALAVRDTAFMAGLLLHEGWHLAGYADHPEVVPPYTTYPWSEQVSCSSRS